MANAKITDLTDLAATPDPDDLLVIVDDPGGTPDTKKVANGRLIDHAIAGWFANQDVQFTREAAGILGIRAAGSGMYLYNSTGVNAEYMRMFWSSNAFRIQPAISGTGTLRDLYLVGGGSLRLTCGNSATAGWWVFSPGTLAPIADNTFDIGSGSLRPRDVFVSRSIQMAGYIEGAEMTEPNAPSANRCRLYLADNGGKTTLYAKFATGSAIEIAAEP